MEEYTNRELGLLLENLCTKVEVGFKGVHDRQDTTNGNVIENKKRISDIEKWRWYTMGGIAVIVFLITLTVKFI